jgi:hypothetical protein
MNLAWTLRFRLLLASRGVPGFTPVIVYQMAKVGSSAVVGPLRALGVPAFHIHRMNRDHLEEMRAVRAALGWRIPPIPRHDQIGLQLRERVIRRLRPAKIITLVRDPIARNLSSYFEHLDAIWNRDHAHESVSIEALQAGFAERFTHDEPLTWFDDEIRPVLGIDVYETPFPASGIQALDDLLILRTELDDEVKASAVAKFLGLGRLSVTATNETTGKRKGDVYRQFRATLRLDPNYVDRMLDARYTSHFYTDDQRAALRRKYVR